MSWSRIRELEAQIADIEKRDPDDPRILILETEADLLAEILNRSEAEEKIRLEEQERLAKELLLAKIAIVVDLVDGGKWDILFEKYSHEFIEDYYVEDGIVRSLVSECEWEVEEPLNKIRQLVNYRIYDKYYRK